MWKAYEPILICSVSTYWSSRRFVSLSDVQIILLKVPFVVQEVVNDIFELPGKADIKPELLQRISRLSGAFTESLGSGKVSISSIFATI